MWHLMGKVLRGRGGKNGTRKARDFEHLREEVTVN